MSIRIFALMFLMTVSSLAFADVNYGRIKWFNGQKGYGFLETSDGSADVYFKLTDVVLESQSTVFNTTYSDEHLCVYYERNEYEAGKFKGVNIQVVDDSYCSK
jgi:hypothetical protein